MAKKVGTVGATSSKGPGTDKGLGLYDNVFYTPAEIADLLSMSRAGVYRLLGVEDPEIPRVRIGQRTLRVFGHHLASFLGVDAPVTDEAPRGQPGLYRNAVYTSEDVGRMIGCSYRTVRRWLEDPESGLKGTRVPGGLAIYGLHLAEFLGLPVEEVPMLSRKDEGS